MPGFVGRYEHSLDAKGRVILPAKFRADFERGGFLAENREGCLALWTLEEFDVRWPRCRSGRPTAGPDRNRARLWASSSHEVEIDRQGRMAITARLREFARLESDVLVIGAIDRIELWNPAVWDERVQPEEQWFLEDEDGLSDRRGQTRNTEPGDSNQDENALRPVHAQPLDRHGGRLLLRPLPRRSPGKLPRQHLARRGAADGPGPTHEPVMAAEVVELFAAVPPGVVLDATVGAGGHAAALLAAHPGLGVLGLDRDPQALDIAAERLAPFGSRAVLTYARFADLDQVVGEARAAGRGHWPSSGEARAPRVDLGGPLRSRRELAAARPTRARVLLPPRRAARHAHGPGRGPSALEVVNDDRRRRSWPDGSAPTARAGWPGGSPAPSSPPGRSTPPPSWPRSWPASVPAAVRRRGHPASRVFQAIRIAVNEESDELAAGLPAALDLLAVGGRCVVIAYHSGEGRLVKHTFANAVTGGCVCPPGLPCGCGAAAEFRWVFRGSRGPRPPKCRSTPGRRAPACGRSSASEAGEKLIGDPAAGGRPRAAAVRAPGPPAPGSRRSALRFGSSTRGPARRGRLLRRPVDLARRRACWRWSSATRCWPRGRSG